MNKRYLKNGILNVLYSEAVKISRNYNYSSDPAIEKLQDDVTALCSIIRDTLEYLDKKDGVSNDRN